MSVRNTFIDESRNVYTVRTYVDGPDGELLLTAEVLINRPSGDLFGMTMDAGMGWPPGKLDRDGILLFSTPGGLHDTDGELVALALHQGHYELGIQIKVAAGVIKADHVPPYAVYISDPYGGCTQGTTGVFDSLSYRNGTSMVIRRLIRSLPDTKAVIDVASYDKGPPAIMMALAAQHNIATALVPGGATLPAEDGEDNDEARVIGARLANDELSLQDTRRAGCKTCASSGGGCQSLGTTRTFQMVAEGLGLAIPHSAPAPSGEPVWQKIVRASMRAALNLN